MNNTDLQKQIDTIEMLIETEEKNYKNALQTQAQYVMLKEIKDNIKKLKNDLQVLSGRVL